MDRYVCCIVGPGNRVHFQSDPLPAAAIPDAVAAALKGRGGALEPLKPGWVITVTPHFSALHQASEADLREIGRRRMI